MNGAEIIPDLLSFLISITNIAFPKRMQYPGRFSVRFLLTERVFSIEFLESYRGSSLSDLYVS